MNMEMILLMPFFIISVFAVVATVIDPLFKNRAVNFWLSLIGLILTALAAGNNIVIQPWVERSLPTADLLSKKMLLFGSFSAYFDILFCIAGILTLLSAKPYLRREYKEYNEFYSLLLFSILGMMMIAHSNHLLVLFLGIELMSISFYILAGFVRTRTLSIEASIKYFLLGSFASGFLLYGMALIYGTAYTMDFSAINSYLKIVPEVPIYFNIGVALLLVGLAFKIAAFPFHQWAPDVYHGSPTVVSGFLSTAGKAAAISAFILVANAIFPFKAAEEVLKIKATSLNIVALISALTMLLGNLTALVQKNVKRMLAYSSVAHAGYLLMGIAANNAEGQNGMVFYATAYIFMQLGAFIIVSVLERDETNYIEFNDYSGLRKAHPWLAAMMAVFLFSLAGIPPFSGFIGKYYLFVAAIKGNFTWLTIVAVISSIISMYYYIGLVLKMYFVESNEKALESDCGTSRISLFITVAATIILGVVPSLILNIIDKF